MKKLIIIVFVFVIMGLTAVLGVAAHDFIAQPIEIAVLSDTHVVAKSLFTADNYMKYATEDKMEHLSEAILMSIVDKLIADKTKYVLISGDLVEYGDETSHLRNAEILRGLKNAGIEVFVINGNHDVATRLELIGKSVTASRFKEIYADFGYSNAVATFDGTLSYAADMGRHYRVIAVDNMGYYPEDDSYYKEEFGAAHEAWVKEQVAKCKEDRRTPILMAHAPLLNHYPKISTLFLDRNQYEKYENFAKSLADNGSRYAVTGHFHVQDIDMVTSANGNEFYDIGTSSTMTYPCAYRKVKLTANSLEVNSVLFDEINTAYLSEFSPESEIAEVAKGLRSYGKAHYYNEISGFVSNVGAADGLLGKLAQGEGNTAKLMGIVADVADKAVSAPFYIEDETSGDVSLERIMKSYGLTIPKTEYKSVAELAPYLISTMFKGDESLAGTAELDIIKYILYGVLYYLDEACEEIAEAFPDMPVINLDIERLFTKGELECYESNLIPFVLRFFDDGGFVFGLIKGAVGNGFNSSLQIVADTYGGKYLKGIFDYFDTKFIKLGELIDDGVFKRYAADFVTDVYPSDNYFYVKFG